MRTLLIALLLLPACKKPVPAASLGEPVPTEAAPAPAPAPAVVQQVVRNFERVHFAFDSAALDEGSKAALRENATLLAAHADVKVEIQGHADERGTTEYNLALGDKRAAAVRSFLLAQGVAPTRLGTVSYGEERPLTGGYSETAWAQNRRAEFRVTYAGDALVEGTTR